MKKLLVGAALVGICLATMGAGVIPRPWNVGVTSSTWTAVTASQSVVNFQVKMRGNGWFKISDESTGGAYYTVATGDTVEFDMPIAKGSILFYLQSGDTTDTAEIFLLNK